MKTVRVHGCLPTLAVLLGVLALGAVAVFFGGVVLAATAGAALLFGAARLVRRLLGLPAGAAASRRPGEGGPGRVRPEVEVLPPGWAEQDATGPVIDVPARPAEGRGDAGAPDGSSERERLPRG
jgi:hypothetical protein